MAEDALFFARDARVDAQGTPCVDGLSVASRGRKVLVLGGPHAVFEAAAGVVAPVRGEIRILGEAATTALAHGHVAGAPLDPAFPPHWTPRRYVEASASLAGASRGDVLAALGALRLESYADAPLRAAVPPVKRATVLAAALATGAKVIVFEDPTQGLPDAVRGSFGRMVASALQPYAWVLFAGRMAPDAPLALEAEWAAVLSGSRVAAEGAPAELAAIERSYALRLLGDTSAFAEQLRSRGARVEGAGESLTVDLGSALGTSDLFRVAEETRATIVELRPIAAAFA